MTHFELLQKYQSRMFPNHDEVNITIFIFCLPNCFEGEGVINKLIIEITSLVDERKIII